MPRVLLACPGLDHAHRGFETFARECFEALRDRRDVDIELVKGSGPRRPRERVLATPTRDHPAVRLLGRATDRRPFVVEHVAFALALGGLLARRSPDVVYFSEWHVGRVLYAWRRASGRPYALVFCNGALASTGFRHLDLVQQLVPGAIEHTVERGESPDRQHLLPLGVAMPPAPRPLGDGERTSLRSRLGLPEGRRIVLSVGAINHQKRVGYLIDEIASLPEPRPYLLLVGQPEVDTPAIRQHAMRRLGPGGHSIRTVAPAAMADHYLAGDAFVLASLWESFGRVLVEAQSNGLPCLAHRYPVMEWVLGAEGDTADLRERGAVSRWLQGLSTHDLSEEARRRRHRHAHQRFSWDALADRYVAMLAAAAQRAGAAA